MTDHDRPNAGPLSGRAFPVIDLHTHPTLKGFQFGFKFWKKHHPPGFMFPLCMRTDIDALIDGNVQCALATVYVLERGLLEDAWPLRYLQHTHPPTWRALNEEPDDMCREQLNHLETVVKETRRRRGDVVEIGRSYDDMHRIAGEGKVCLLHAIEGAHVLNGNLENLEDFHRRGVCHMIIPHFYPNEATYTVDAIPDNEPLKRLGLLRRHYHLDKGLKPFGRELLDRMLTMGMIPDLTHGTPPMRQESIEIAKNHPSKRPVIMSHVGVHHYAPYPMNPTDEDIKGIADTGGVVGIIMMNYWLKKPEEKMGKDIVLKTINHLIDVGGEDVVAFGSDFDGFTGPPKDIKSPRDFNGLREFLLHHFPEAQVDKFLRGNADRVLREGWVAPAEN